MFVVRFTFDKEKEQEEEEKESRKARKRQGNKRKEGVEYRGGREEERKGFAVKARVAAEYTLESKQKSTSKIKH